MNYESYDEYIQSKTYLIDEIPSHWEIVPMNQFVSLVTDYVANGSFASLRANVEYKNEEDYAILVRLADNTNNFSGPFVYIDEDAYNFLSKSKLYEGDIVLSNTGSIGSIFKVPNLGKPMSLGPNSLLIRFDNQILANYFFYLFDCDIGMKFLESITTVTTQPKFNKTDFRKLPMIMPPFDEQKQIANYLDKKTVKIDATIAKNEELIQLLEEKRVALINQVVTKGLNPDVPMKDSGVEWIGEIPEHWSISRLKFLINKNAQYGANCEPEPDETKFDYRYVRITDIDDDASLKDNIVYLCKEDAKGFVLKEGDILFARSGATVGKTYLYDSSDGDCCFAGYLIRYVPNKLLLNPKYLLYFSFSKSYTEWIKIVSTQATIQNVSADKYDNLIISLPDVDEQNKIVSFLDDKITNINKTISKIQENINLLEEYKTSLIHHVVTGKIDVRGEEI